MTFRLRRQSVALRIGVTCFLAMIAIGYRASVRHMHHHLGPKDGDPDSVSFEDVAGHYHGVEIVAPLKKVLDDADHTNRMREAGVTLADAQRQVLEAWLARGDEWVAKGRSGADPIAQFYDPLDGPPDADTPAIVLEESCGVCHASDAKQGDEASRALPLMKLVDVQKVAYSQTIQPVPEAILLASLHTHALGLATFTTLAALFFFMTAWPRRLRDALIALTGVGLLLDVAAWEPARDHVAWVYVILGGGALFGIGLCLMMLGTFLDMWFGPRGEDA